MSVEDIETELDEFMQYLTMKEYEDRVVFTQKKKIKTVIWRKLVKKVEELGGKNLGYGTYEFPLGGQDETIEPQQEPQLLTGEDYEAEYEKREKLFTEAKKEPSTLNDKETKLLASTMKGIEYLLRRMLVEIKKGDTNV